MAVRDRVEVRAPARGLRLVLVLGTLTAIGPLSIDMYLPGFPAVARELGTSVAAVQLTLATYLAGLAVGQLLYGPVSDRVGRRPPLMAGLVVYAAAAVACAAAPSLGFLAAARFVQALGGCAGLVISRAVVRDHFDVKESARVYSALMLVMGAAPILAPLLGGQVLAAGGWRAIFALLACVGAAMLGLVALGLPESLAPEARVRRSAGETARALAGVLAHGRFVRLSLAGGAIQAAMFAYIAGSPYVFIELYGVPPARFGLVFGANAVGIIGSSQVNRWLAGRVGVARALRGGIAVALAAYAVLHVAARAHAPLAAFIPPLWVGVSCVGVVLPSATAAAMASYGAQAGSASAVLGVLQAACGAIASTAVSALADGTARPMAGVMLTCGVLAAALVVVDVVREGPARSSTV